MVSGIRNFLMVNKFLFTIILVIVEREKHCSNETGKLIKKKKKKNKNDARRKKKTIPNAIPMKENQKYICIIQN